MSSKVQFITEVGMMTAAAVILSFIKFKAPWAYGGSVSLEMLPIVLMGFRHGLKGGLITGLVFGIVKMMLGPEIFHPIQGLLDYPVAFIVVGFAGLVRPRVNSTKLNQVTIIVLGTLIGSGLRFVSHFLSAIIWFGQYAPKGVPVPIYAAVYNLGYMVPSFLLVTVVLILVIVTAPQIVKVRSV